MSEALIAEVSFFFESLVICSVEMEEETEREWRGERREQRDFQKIKRNKTKRNKTIEIK